MKFLLTAALFAFTATATQAAIAVTNLNLPSTDGGWATYTDQFIASSFTVGNGAPQWSFESADLLITNFRNVPVPIIVELHADNGGSIGATIIGLNFTDAPNGQAFLNFTSPSPILFDAGATYWLTVTSPCPDSQVGWIYTDPNDVSETGEPDWSIRDSIAVSHDGGSTWTDFPGTNPGLYTINASPVPEPTTAVLALSMLGLFVPRRRK